MSCALSLQYVPDVENRCTLHFLSEKAKAMECNARKVPLSSKTLNSKMLFSQFSFFFLPSSPTLYLYWSLQGHLCKENSTLIFVSLFLL